MRRGYAPLLMSLLLVLPGILLIDNSDTGVTGLSTTVPSTQVPTRGPIEWEPVGTTTVSSYLNDTSQIDIQFDIDNSTFSASEPYDPYFDHNSTVRAAIDASPQWLNDSLSWRFSEFWSHPGQKWAELLLNDSIDWRFKDEIAFIISHLPSQITYSMWVWPELIVENVEMIYKVASEVPYASLTDTNSSDGLRTTITYAVSGGNITLPDEVYYENLVMPRNSLENPNYVNRSTKRYTYPDQGWFWRKFLYYEADDGYPVLRNMLINQTVLWTGTMNQVAGNGAIGAVTQWQMQSMVFGMPDHRSSQPVLAYGEHIGMCGENSYLLAAVAKTALIPAVTVINFDWMHGWNMFYDRGWHIWRAYDGIIDDTNAEGTTGSVNAHMAFNPDSSVFNAAYLHTQTSNLTVRVVDEKGVPVDGAMVKLYSSAVTNYRYGNGLIGNHTNVNGEARFSVGVGFQYYAQIVSPIGMYLDEEDPIPLALPGVGPGGHYWFNVTLNRSMPLKANYSKLLEQEYGLKFNVTINEMEQLTRPTMDPMGYDKWYWKGHDDDRMLRILLLDDENYTQYLAGNEFYPAAVINATHGLNHSVIVPDGVDWHIISTGLSNPLTRSLVNYTLQVSRSTLYPEAIILTPDPGYYYLGEELTFNGKLDPYPPYLGEVQYRWFISGSSSPLSEEQSFNWTAELGRYEISFTVWKGSELLDSDSILFEVLMPNREPEAYVSSPVDGAVFVAGTIIEFESVDTNDPDGDPLEYVWTEPSIGLLLSNMSSFSRKFIVGEHTVRLKVTDPDGLWATDEVSFTVVRANIPPIPYIRSPEDFNSFYNDQLIHFSANGSYDLDMDELSYLWQSNRTGTFSTEMDAWVYLPPGVHRITMTVDDGNETSSINITVYIETRPEIVDLAPIAVISHPSEGQGFFIRDLISFRSDGSYDPEGYSLSYLWTIDGYNVSTEPNFSMYLKDGIHSVLLTVFDVNSSTTATRTIVVTNRAPIIQMELNGSYIDSGQLVVVIENDTLVLSASGSHDPDGTLLYYRWTLDGNLIGSGTVVEISLLQGYHEIRLVVTDEDNRATIFTVNFNCIRSDIDDGPPNNDGDDNRSISSLYYIIPVALILTFLIVAMIFFLLSRDKKDVYFEE